MKGKFKFYSASPCGWDLLLLFVVMLSVPSRLSTDVLENSSSTSVVCPTTLKVVFI